MKEKTIIPPSEKHLRIAIRETIDKIDRIEKIRSSKRDELSAEEQNSLRLKVLELQERFLTLSESLNDFPQDII